MNLHELKLGKHAPKLDARTFQLSNYTGSLPTPPASKSWVDGITDWPMWLNDVEGDCTIAGANRLRLVWTKNSTGTGVVTSDADTQKAYQAVSGYVPGDESTDNGANMLDVLNYWRKTGIGGDKIYAFAKVDGRNRTQIEQAIMLFGGLYVGAALPITAQGQTRPGGTWSVLAHRGRAAAPGSWGGHCFASQGWSPAGLQIVPWGTPDVGLMTMGWNFTGRYVDECYVVLSSQDWAEKTLAPSGFDLATLKADLAKL